MLRGPLPRAAWWHGLRLAAGPHLHAALPIVHTHLPSCVRPSHLAHTSGSGLCFCWRLRNKTGLQPTCVLCCVVALSSIVLPTPAWREASATGKPPPRPHMHGPPALDTHASGSCRERATGWLPVPPHGCPLCSQTPAPVAPHCLSSSPVPPPPPLSCLPPPPDRPAWAQCCLIYALDTRRLAALMTCTLKRALATVSEQRGHSATEQRGNRRGGRQI